MSFAQKDRLDRIRHTSLLTTEKKFHRKRPKNDDFRDTFWVATTYATTQYINTFNYMLQIVFIFAKFPHENLYNVIQELETNYKIRKINICASISLFFPSHTHIFMKKFT